MRGRPARCLGYRVQQIRALRSEREGAQPPSKVVTTVQWRQGRTGRRMVDNNQQQLRRPHRKLVLWRLRTRAAPVPAPSATVTSHGPGAERTHVLGQAT